MVSLTLTSDGENSGKTKFAEATKNNVGKQIAIVYDNNIISAPNVNEEISGGKAQISGMSDWKKHRTLLLISVSVLWDWNWKNFVPVL